MLTRDITLRGFKRTVDPAAEELALCRRIAGGERQLFGQLIDQYSGLVAGAISAQGVDAADIDDLAQQAFVNVFKGLHGFRGDARLSSWIYRIAMNVARAHLKRRAERPQPESVELAMESGQQPADTRAGAASEWTGQVALRQAMLRLPEVQRTALALFYFEELSYEEIAQALRLNLNTVRTHIRRGKQRLAGLLDESLLDSGT
jgi:RNA polymerase sigma-70 factor (ECF subfamily)